MADSEVQKDLTWVQKHERLFLAVIAGFVLWFSIGRIDTLIANHDHANLQQAQVAAQVQQEKNDALAQQMAQHDADVKALDEKIQARDEQLTQLQAQLVAALTKQQATDSAMTTPEIAQRWQQLVPDATVKPVPAGGVSLTDAGAHATVAELEKVPVLTQQLSATNEALSNAQTLLTAEGQQVSDRDALITGLRAKAGDDAKVCAAQIATVKAEARRSKRRWFVAGYVAGWLSRQAVKTYTGF